MEACATSSIRIGPFGAFGFRFVLEGNDPEFVRLVARLLRGLRCGDSDDVPTVVRVERSETGRSRLTIDGDHRFETGDPAVLLHHLVWEITRRAIRADSAPMVLHAGAVVFDEIVVLLCGRSGAGKSTTVAALVAAGGGYLTDEAVRLAADGSVTGWLPRPLQLDARSHDLLGLTRSEVALVHPDTSSYLALDAGDPPTAPVPPERVLLVELGETEGDVSVATTAGGEIVAAMMRQGFEPGRSSQSGLDAAAELAGAARVYRLSGGTPRGRADAIREIVDATREILICDHGA